MRLNYGHERYSHYANNIHTAVMLPKIEHNLKIALYFNTLLTDT